MILSGYEVINTEKKYTILSIFRTFHCNCSILSKKKTQNTMKEALKSIFYDSDQFKAI